MNAELITLVERAIADMAAEGIEGWGIGNPAPDAFRIVETGPSVGCISDTCAHNSHDPASPTYRLLPTNGELVSLGHDEGSDYYVHVGERVRGFVVTADRGYYDRVREVDPNQIPAWAIARIVDAARELIDKRIGFGEFKRIVREDS